MDIRDSGLKLPIYNQKKFKRELNALEGIPSNYFQVNYFSKNM